MQCAKDLLNPFGFDSGRRPGTRESRQPIAAVKG